jgi:toxin FitB
MGWLLDTNVLSELRRPKPDQRVVEFVATRQLSELFVSVVTVAEIRFGIERVSDPSRRADLDAWLNQKVRPMFYGRVLPVTEDILLRWRLIVEQGRKEGYTHSVPDSIIAATAIHHGLVVVTRDHEAYGKALAAVVNPWDS